MACNVSVATCDLYFAVSIQLLLPKKWNNMLSQGARQLFRKRAYLLILNKTWRHCIVSDQRFKEMNFAGWVSGVCDTWLHKSTHLSWCNLALADWHPKPSLQHLSTEYRVRRDSPEESNVHNCISWIHFKWQVCKASHLCMHLITHSLNSPGATGL